MVGKVEFQITYHHLTKVGGMRDISIGLPPTFFTASNSYKLKYLDEVVRAGEGQLLVNC